MWYPADSHPPVLLQLRAWFSGRLAPIQHPSGGWYDYAWGRSGMHTNFGLGLPLLSIPFHLAARLLGAPGFPDHVRFLVLYAITTALFARALHRVSRPEPSALVASAGVSVFVLAFPTLVGLIAARFRVYDETIATGALWTVLLLAGILGLLERSTTARLVIVCAAASFATFLRPPLAAYGLTTVALAILVAQRRGLALRGLVAGVGAGALVAALYLVANFVRFGSPFEAGYANIVSAPFVNRLTRWGVEFDRTPFVTAAKEMFATLFLLEPVGSLIISTTPASVPASVARYAVGERWREYDSPAYDLWVFAAWVVTFGIVVGRVVGERLWRRDRDPADQVTTIVGIWALPPSLALFLFYSKVHLATRYLVDLYPAYAAAVVCVGMALVDVVRRRAPRRVAAAQAAIAAVAVLNLCRWRGWPHDLSHPVDRKTVEARLAEVDLRSRSQPIPPANMKSTDPRQEPAPVFGNLGDWNRDGSFRSGMVFAFPYSPCVTFALGPAGNGGWGPADEESLAGLRVHADFDALVSCGAPTDDGETRSVTMCEPHPPRFLLDGMRLYAVATLDANLRPIDRLKIRRIDAASACP
jgi:hypothetical protein